MSEADTLQIKIDSAKAQLSSETLLAIQAVPWQAHILKLRETKGYSFEQLGDLETETELVLCGLISLEDYPRELEQRMKISREEANELVREMNTAVFGRIRDELIKITERRKGSAAEAKEGSPGDTLIKREERTLASAGIKIIEPRSSSAEKEEQASIPVPAAQAQKALPLISSGKLSAPTQATPAKTEYSITGNRTVTPPAYTKGGDPYRLPPE